MKIKRLIYIFFVLLLWGCSQKTKKQEQNQERTQEQIQIKEENYSYYKISQEDLGSISESNKLTNAVRVLTVYDAEGVVPDIKYFNRVENLNILTKKSVTTLVVGQFINNTVKRVFINNGISDGDAEKVKYGDIDTIIILPLFLNLQYIKIYDSSVNQIKVPEVISSLEELEIKGPNNISDVSFLKNLPHIKQLYLDLASTNSTVLNVGENIDLEEICVSGNIKSFEGLDVCKNLTAITLRDLPNVDIIASQIPGTVRQLAIAHCKNVTISIVEMLAEQIKQIYFAGDIIFRDEDVKDYGDRELGFEGEKAMKYFMKFIEKDEKDYMRDGKESFMVGKTKYTIRETNEP
jgi:hypothetical protein